MAPTPSPWRAIDSSVALWCSPVASRTSSSRGSGSSVIAAARPSSSSVVSPIADTTTTRSLPAARSRAIRRATRLMRSASATDEPPNFWTTRGAGMAGAFYRASPVLPEAPYDGDHRPLPSPGGRPMCFDHDSRPPIAPIAGGALDAMPLVLTAADRNRFAAFRARASEPIGGRRRDPARRSRPASVLRGARPALRRARDRRAGDRLVRADRRTRAARRRLRLHAPHPAQTTWAGIPADITAAVEEIRSPEDGRAAPGSVFTLGFCMGGRMSFLAGTLGLGLAGVIGMYGTLAGPWRNDAPAPVDVAGADRRRPSSACSAAPTRSSRPRRSPPSTTASAAAGVDHRLVTYPGAPHSFFDRKAAEFADESAAAWDEVLAFIRARTA